MNRPFYILPLPLLILLLIVMIGSLRTAHAVGLPYSFATTPGELPKDVVPLHYAILVDTDMASLSFTGSENVVVHVLKPTRTFVINDLNLLIKNVALSGLSGPVGVTMDKVAQTATLTFPTHIKPGMRTLSLAFSGAFESAPQGLFYLKYWDGGKQEIMISTQFESTDARRMFPGWDEPSFRATFQLTAEVPSDFTAVGNMPIVGTSPGKPGYKRVSFAPTPSMPSYLLELSAGHLESVGGMADGIPVHVYTTRGKAEKARYAVEVEQEILPYYNGYYGYRYPLPKLDLIALPGGFNGAMENWGAITYNDSAVLYDPALESLAREKEVFDVIAHETAHQWTGDLVTTAWWDDIWLNEGFADWMDVKAAQQFYPQWNPWVDADNDKYKVMNVDALTGSHAVHQVLSDPLQFGGAFDDVTYTKGQSVIRMLETYLGEPVFEAGMKEYIARRKFSNATTPDLWAALTKVSGQPMARIGGPWIDTPGFPVVTASTAGSGLSRRLLLSQKRYLADPAASSGQLWIIPVTFRTLDPNRTRTFLMTGKTASVPAPGAGPLLINAGNTGYYRVHYDPALWQSISAVGAALPPGDQIALLSDRWALVRTGDAPVDSYLDLTNDLGSQTNSNVWDQMISHIDYINSLEIGTSGEANFHTYACDLMRPLLQNMGTTPVNGENLDIATLRPELFSHLGNYGDPSTIASARAMFASYVKDPGSVPVSLQSPMFDIVGHWADQTTYDQLHAMALATSDFSLKQRYYGAMTGAVDPALARESLALVLSGERPDPYGPFMLFHIGGSGEHHQMVWDFYKANLAAIEARLDADSRATFAPYLMSGFHDDAHADEFTTFAAQNLSADMAPQVATRVQQIRLDASFSRDYLPAADRWFGAHFMAE